MQHSTLQVLTGEDPAIGIVHPSRPVLVILYDLKYETKEKERKCEAANLLVTFFINLIDLVPFILFLYLPVKIRLHTCHRYYALSDRTPSIVRGTNLPRTTHAGRRSAAPFRSA